MFSKETYIERRKKLAAAVNSGVILLPGNDEIGMNYKDNTYHFRQDSNFLYFAGLDKPNLFLIIDVDNGTETLFGDDLTVDDIVWTGPMPSLASQAARAGITQVQPTAAIEAIIKNSLSKKQAIHFTPPYRGETANRLSEWLGISYKALKDQASVTLIKAIVAQRSIKSEEEIQEIEKAVNTTVQMHTTAIQMAKDGVLESEIAGQLQAIAISAGGNLAFPTILTVNGQILHNHASHNVLKNGLMSLCDSGAETAMHYAGDMTRTCPVDAHFTSLQKEAYEIVLTAHESAIAALKPGVLYKDVHLLACTKLAEGLKGLGLMKGDPAEAVANNAHALFFQCGLGHMMGLDVHDMENLGEQYVGYTDDMKKSTEFGLKSLRLGRALEPGFVLTVEPGLYFIPELIDIWKGEKKHTNFLNYDKIETFKTFGGIRIEDDFVITASGSRLLGKPLARSVADVESL